MKHKNKTLVILSPGFPKNEADSTCLPAQQSFVNALRKNFPNIQFIIVSFQYPYSDVPYLWNGVQVIPFNGQGRGKLYRVRLWMRVWKTLQHLHKENELIGLFSFWVGECALVGKYFGMKNHIKHYSWILGQDAKKENKYVQRIHPRSDQLIAMSEFLRRKFNESHGIKPLHIVPNGVEPGLYADNNSERGIDILGVGSLIPLKQYDLFIKMLRRISDYHPVNAVICGKGPEEKKLQSMIDELDLTNVIKLAGEKPHKEVLQMMQQSKIFLHTSSYEGFSSVCLEALYAGAHVISFCKPINASVKHWYFVETEEEMFLTAIQLLKYPPENYDPVLVYSLEDSAKKLMSLFDN